MDENVCNFYKKNYNENLKKKTLIFPIKVEYNIISDFLLNSNILKTFFRKEMENISCQTLFQIKEPKTKNININNNEKNDYNYFIIQRNKNEKINDIFKAKCIYKKHCLNHSLVIIRFIKEEDLNNNKDVNNNINKEQFLDTIISFYIDISNNYTILINELNSNLSDSLFRKFIDIVHLFYKRLKIFVREKINKFYCFESILIPKNINYIFNYLKSCKIFHNEKFKIQKIQKIKQDIEITCQIIFTENVSESKLFIKYISKNNCLVEIVNWMKTANFNTQEKLLNIKSITSLFLKKLRCRIKTEDSPVEKEKEIKKNEI